MTKEELRLFGERLRRCRQKTPYTQEEMAEKADISLRFYQSLEGGAAKPSLKTLLKFQRILTVSLDYLILGDTALSPEDPVSKIYHEMTPKQREGATQILQLYWNACNDK